MGVETEAKSLQISEEAAHAKRVGWSCVRVYEDYSVNYTDSMPGTQRWIREMEL